MQNILDPGAVVEPRFVNYHVVTRDRRSISGVIKAETGTSLTLAAGNGATETVARSDVKEIRATGVSMMPEGFEAAFTPRQMADLIAYLKSPSRKSFSGNKPEVVTASPDGSLHLSATKAEIYADQIAFESEFQNIGMWMAPTDYAAWTLQMERSADYDIYFDYACAQYSGGNKFRLTAGNEMLTGVVAATGADWSRYKQLKVGTLRLEAGKAHIIVKPDGPLHDALIDLRAVVLKPAGIAPRRAAPAGPSPPSRLE